MRTLILIAYLLMSLNSFAQRDSLGDKPIDKDSKVLIDIPKIDGAYGYQEVVLLDSNYKKDDLYRNCKLYFVDVFKSAKDVIQYDDKEQGKVIGKGFFSITDSQQVFMSLATDTYDVYYTTEISVKDGKYRYRLYDIHIKDARQADRGIVHYTELTIDDAIAQTKHGVTKKMAARMFNKMAQIFKSQTDDLKVYMKKTNGSTKDDF